MTSHIERHMNCDRKGCVYGCVWVVGRGMKDGRTFRYYPHNPHSQLDVIQISSPAKEEGGRECWRSCES